MGLRSATPKPVKYVLDGLIALVLVGVYIVIAVGSDPTGKVAPAWMRSVSGTFVAIMLFGGLIAMVVLTVQHGF